MPALVEAVNAVFAAPSPFVVPEIEYRPVAAARSGGNPAALRSWWRRWCTARILAPAGARTTASTIRRRARTARTGIVARATANEIARLLDLAARGEATIDGDPLTGADVAVLVRTRAQGRRVAEALRVRGVRSAEIDDRSVFETDDAEQVERTALGARRAGAGSEGVRGGPRRRRIRP